MKYEVVNGKLKLMLKPPKEPEPSGLVPMQNAYQGPAFGGQKKQKLYTDSRGPVDLRRQSSWVQIASYDTNEFQTGVLGADATAQKLLKETEGSTTFYVADVFAEVRAIGYIAGNPFILAQAAIAHRPSLPETLSAGQFRHVITEGQMPDRIELQARSVDLATYDAWDIVASPSGGGGYSLHLMELILQVSTWVRFLR